MTHNRHNLLFTDYIFYQPWLFRTACFSSPPEPLVSSAQTALVTIQVSSLICSIGPLSVSACISSSRLQNDQHCLLNYLLKFKLLQRFYQVQLQVFFFSVCASIRLEWLTVPVSWQDKICSKYYTLFCPSDIKQGFSVKNEQCGYSKSEVKILSLSDTYLSKNSSLCNENIHQLLPAAFTCQPEVTETHCSQNKATDLSYWVSCWHTVLSKKLEFVGATLQQCRNW